MSNFHWLVDGSIVLIYLALVVGIGLWVRRFVRGLDDFLLAGRRVDIYLGIASLAATEFGIATCMANAELGYRYGFAGITPGLALATAMFVVGMTGFCINRLREQEVVTLPELFEQKFGPHVRWAGALVIVLGGLLNMGVFLRQAGEFLSIVLGLNLQYLTWTLTIILILIVLYTVVGGMLSVIVTDYIQFIFMGLGLVATVVVVVMTLGWGKMTGTVLNELGPAGVNPLLGSGYGWDRIVFDFLVSFASVLTWQTMLSRVLSAKDSATGQKIYTRTAPFFIVRFLLPAVLGIGALHYFAGPAGGSVTPTTAMPLMLSALVPVGLFGLLIAAMLSADMSTNSSYMLAWSSVIFNDLLRPLHHGQWSSQRSIRVNRILVVLVGVFLLIYGLWYPVRGDLWTYMQVTGTVYLASMSVLLIAVCYWKNTNDWGAIAAIFTGAALPITFLILQQVPWGQAMVTSIGTYKIGIMTYLMTGLAMLAGSWLKTKWH